MVDKQCFERGCVLDVEYLCKCAFKVTYSCKKHSSKHLKLKNRAHALESIWIENIEWKKQAVLKFLATVASCYINQENKILASFSHHVLESENGLRNLMGEIDAHFAELNNIRIIIAHVTKILKSERDPILGLLNLDPEEAIEKLNTIIPTSPDWYNAAKAIYSEAEKHRLGSIINEGNKNLKIFEEEKEKALVKREGKIDTNLCKLKIQYSGGSKSPKDTILEIFEGKGSQNFNKPNDAELEQEFKTTCLIYEGSAHDHSLEQAYQEYQKTRIYNLFEEEDEDEEKDDRTALYIYDTERESKEKKILQTPEVSNLGTCIAQLPNGKLFCYGKDNPISGITVLIDENCAVEVLPSGNPCGFSSAIFFNQNVYCFGGSNGNNALTLSRRFDLVQNRWRELTPMPRPNYECSSIIFNGNILISGFYNGKILLYSIDIDSYSTIPYDFAKGKIKILINAERLYLIECGWDGSIYESETGSDTAWRRIAQSTIDYDPDQVYCAYNKGRVYIGMAVYDIQTRTEMMKYFKFNLDTKDLAELP